MFVEKTQALKEKEELRAHSSSLESTVVKACKTVPELHIPEDAQLEAKIKKLVTGVREARTKVGQINLSSA